MIRKVLACCLSSQGRKADAAATAAVSGGVPVPSPLDSRAVPTVAAEGANAASGEELSETEEADEYVQILQLVHSMLEQPLLHLVYERLEDRVPGPAFATALSEELRKLGSYPLTKQLIEIVSAGVSTERVARAQTLCMELARQVIDNAERACPPAETLSSSATKPESHLFSDTTADSPTPHADSAQIDLTDPLQVEELITDIARPSMDHTERGVIVEDITEPPQSATPDDDTSDEVGSSEDQKVSKDLSIGAEEEQRDLSIHQITPDGQDSASAIPSPAEHSLDQTKETNQSQVEPQPTEVQPEQVAAPELAEAAVTETNMPEPEATQLPVVIRIVEPAPQPEALPSSSADESDSVIPKPPPPSEAEEDSSAAGTQREIASEATQEAEAATEVATEAPEAATEVATEVAPEAQTEVAPEAAAEVAPEAATEVAPEAATEAAPSAAPSAAPEMALSAAHEATPSAAPVAACDLPALTAPAGTVKEMTSPAPLELPLPPAGLAEVGCESEECEFEEQLASSDDADSVSVGESASTSETGSSERSTSCEEAASCESSFADAANISPVVPMVALRAAEEDGAQSACSSSFSSDAVETVIKIPCRLITQPELSPAPHASTAHPAE